jgi:phosphate transport system substrate-binding protein
MRFSTKLLTIALGCVMALPAAAQQITGAGSTFVYPILSKWSDAYNCQIASKSDPLFASNSDPFGGR